MVNDFPNWALENVSTLILWGCYITATLVLFIIGVPFAVTLTAFILLQVFCNVRKHLKFPNEDEVSNLPIKLSPPANLI